MSFVGSYTEGKPKIDCSTGFRSHIESNLEYQNVHSTAGQCIPL